MRKSAKGGIVFLLALVGLLSPIGAFAIGQITAPIEIKNALRTKTYEESITVINTEMSKAIIDISAEGDIAGWTRFYSDSKSQDNITSIEIPAMTKTSIVARITVPDGKPNGTYSGIISVSKKAGEFRSSEESGSSVSQKVDRDVTIDVQDNEQVSFDASIIPEKYDLTKDDTLKIRVIYDNQSNVEIAPQITFRIKSGDQALYNAIFPYPENEGKVQPGTIKEITSLEIPLSTLQDGKYEAGFKMEEGSKFSLDKDFTFSIGMVKAASTTESTKNTSRNDGRDLLPLAFLAILGIYLLPPLYTRFKKHRQAPGNRT